MPPKAASKPTRHRKPKVSGVKHGSEKKQLVVNMSPQAFSSLQLVESHLQEENTVVVRKKTETKGDGHDTYENLSYVIDIPPTVMNAFKGMFSPNQIYRFRMTRTASVVTSGGGTMSLATGVYPGQFDQYTALSILFSQSRLVQTKIDYMLLASQAQTQSTVYSTLPGVFVSAFDPAQYGGSTQLYQQVQRRPGCVQFATSYTGKKITNFYKVKEPRLWSNIATQSGTDPYGGNAGAWLIALANVASTTTTYWQYVITADYEFTALY